MDFNKAIQQSQKLPELPEDMERDLPDFLKQEPVSVARRAHGEAGTFPGATKYDATYNCDRLMIGQVVEAYEKGNPIFRDVDDSDRLREIMDSSLQGKAVILKKQENILKDGTVVVWIEWAEHKQAAPPADREYLTETELRTPSTPTPSAEDTEEMGAGNT